MSFAIKKAINKQLREVGVKAFDAAAVNLLTEYINTEGTLDALKPFISVLKSDGTQSDRLTADAVQSALAQLRGGRQAVEVTNVINAFEVPKISYDPVGRKLYKDTSVRSILGPATSKQQLYIDRLHLISQRIRRNELFQQKSLTSTSDAPSLHLTDIQSLKGVVGARKVVLACISHSEDGRYTLEDHSGQVPLDLSDAQTAAGFFTENCIVIAEGEMRADGVFHATAVGFPPCEPRENLPMAAQRLNFFGGPSLSNEDNLNLMVEEASRADDRMLVLSNVHLDQRSTLDALNQIFTIYHENVEQLPTMIVLMGNFHSKAASSAMQSSLPAEDADFGSLRAAFDSLAALIEQYPRIRTDCKFVFVPGPGDPAPSATLPQPPLPAFLTAELRRVLPTAVFGSNPCRVRYLSREIVLFRYDILARMRRRCLIAPKDSGGWLAGTQTTQATQAGSTQATAKAMWGHLTLTLLQQSHLCPLPLVQQPIYWQYDCGLALYPLPHAVVIADSSSQANYTHQGCTVFNPGSFTDGLFAAYKPVTGEVEDNEVPRSGFEIPEIDEYEQDGSAIDVHVDAQELESFEAGNKKMRAGDSPRSSPPDLDLLPRSRDQDGGAGVPPRAFAALTSSPLQTSPVQPSAAMDEEDAFEADIDSALARRAAANQSTDAGTADQDMWDAIVANEGGPQDMEAQANVSMVHAGFD